MGKLGVRAGRRVSIVVLLVLVGSFVGASLTQAQKKPPTCNLIPQLRDLTINQGVGAYSPLVNGKETLVRFFLSMPSCAGSGASIQLTGGTLAVSGGGTVAAPTPVPSPTAYPVLASFTAAPMADSTGDPKFVVPASMVARTSAFTATFSTTLSYRSRPTTSSPYSAIQTITFTNRPGTSTPISASFDRPSNAMGILFVPMGDATKTYSSQWTATGQQSLQDGMTSAVSRAYPLPAGIGNLGGTGGLRYMVAPTLLDLKRLNLIDVNGKFCGTGANYDLIKAELAQFRLSHNAVNPTAQANRVVGVVDPAVGLGPPSPCFEGMAVVNSQEAWALARPGRTGQLLGLEIAHTLGLTPPSRESLFDGAHSQNIAAENPSLNRRYNVVQRGFIVTDRSLMKPSATNPSGDNVNTLLEVPDFAFLLCVFGGTPNSECTTHGPGTVNANAPVAATLSFVMSGTTTSDNPGGICPTCTGAGTGTSVVESYFASTVPQTAPSPTSQYRLVQRASAGSAILSNLGVPVGFRHSEHGSGSGSTDHASGLFSFALPFETNANRIELWKGAPGAAGSLLIYARDRTTPPVVSSMTVGGEPIPFRAPGFSPGAATAAPQAVETLYAEAGTPAGATSITTSTPLSAPISFGNSFSAISTLCLHFHFIGDVLDPGEQLSTSWAGGFINAGATPQQDRTLCVSDQANRDRLVDGSEPMTISMESGSVSLGALVISIVADPIAPVGYRISSDAPSYTVAQGSSVPIDITVTDDPDAASPPAVALTARVLLPAGGGTGFTLNPADGTPTFTSDGTLNTSASTAPGNYRLVVTAKGGGFTRSFDVNVTVTASSAALVVNSENDVTDGTCNGAHCSLREAINASNASVGTADTITFDIPTSDFPSIALTSALPTITDPVTIDATTQDSGTATPDVNLDGSDAGPAAHGFNVTAGSTTIKGFVIDDFSLDGIHLQGGGGNTVVGNWIGIDISGNEPSPNAGDGIQMEGSDDNQIGGTTAADRNVVSASGGHGIFMFDADGNTVEGNYVGTDVAGDDDFGNTIDGIAVDGGSNNTIGPDNVTAGNTNQGVALFRVGAASASNNNTVIRNTVGLGADRGALPNGGVGVLVASGTGNTVVENSIAENGGLGIDLAPPNGVTANDEGDGDEGPNNLQNFPVLASAEPQGGSVRIQGTLSSTPSTTFRVDYYAGETCDDSGFGEGERWIGWSEGLQTTTDASGEASFDTGSGLTAPTSPGEWVTATATHPDGNTSEFSECIQIEESSLPEGQEPVEVTATDDNPGDDTLDLYLDCGPSKPKHVIAVGLVPNNITATTASWSTHYDSSLAPANCELKSVVMDGFNRSGFTATGTETVDDGPNALVAAISSPRPSSNILQYGLIPLRGSIRNAEIELGGGQLQWTLSGPGITRTGTGTILDLQPPSNGGWPNGSYTATLTTTGAGPSGTDTVTFNVRTDNDNDGMSSTTEAQGCFGANADNDPLNADDDSDNDGIPNTDDPQPCVPASSYTAIIEFNPDPFPTPSNGNTVTVTVRVPGRNVGQVLSGSVRIIRIADENVSTNIDFRNIAWTVSGGVGTAKFDRQKLIAWLAARNIDDRTITVVVAGSSGAPAWSFEGSDTVFITD